MFNLFKRNPNPSGDGGNAQEAPTVERPRSPERTAAEMVQTLDTVRKLDRRLVDGYFNSTKLRHALPLGITYDHMNTLQTYVSDVKAAHGSAATYPMVADSMNHRAHLVYDFLKTSGDDPAKTVAQWDYERHRTPDDEVADWDLHIAITSTRKYLDHVYGPGGADTFISEVSKQVQS